MRVTDPLKATGLSVAAVVLMLVTLSAMSFDVEADRSIHSDSSNSNWLQQERDPRQERPARQQERPMRERQTQQRQQPQRETQRGQPLSQSDLVRFNLREGMTIPRDGRTVHRFITPDVLPQSGLRFDGDDDCVCMCDQSGCSPAGCGNCPVPLCPGGYVPPCPDGASALPGVYGVLDGMRALR